MRQGKRNEKVVGRILSAALALALAVGSPGFASQAAEAGDWPEAEEAAEVEALEAELMENPVWPSDVHARTMLTECIISVSGNDEAMCINIVTGSVGTASVLGVKDIKIYKKNWLGLWTLVATSSGGEGYNCSISGVSIKYANAVKDATYKITCIHYGDVDGYIEGENDSGAFVYSFYQ